VYKNKGKY